jgi:hypothetical protein
VSVMVDSWPPPPPLALLLRPFPPSRDPRSTILLGTNDAKTFNMINGDVTNYTADYLRCAAR